MCESRLARGATSAVHPPKIIKYHTHKQRHTELVTMTIPSGRKPPSFLTPCVLIPSCGKKEFSQMSRYNSHSKTNRPPPSSTRPLPASSNALVEMAACGSCWRWEVAGSSAHHARGFSTPFRLCVRRRRRWRRCRGRAGGRALQAQAPPISPR